MRANRNEGKSKSLLWKADAASATAAVTFNEIYEIREWNKGTEESRQSEWVTSKCRDWGQTLETLNFNQTCNSSWKLRVSYLLNVASIVMPAQLTSN